jgi:hypothetical protein
VRVTAATAIVSVCALAIVAPGDPGWTQALLARADDVAKEVATVRGLKQKRRIKRDVVDETELRRRLVERATRAHNAAELAAEERAFKRWGLLPPTADYAKLLVDVLTEQIAGFYDPETATLYIAQKTLDATSGADAAERADMLLAHEIDHALQDQHFDLDKFTDLPATEGDALLARRALVEGDGLVLMIELLLRRKGTAAPWGDPMVSSLMQRALDMTTSPNRLSSAPLRVREALLFPYRAGLGFVADVRRRQPWTAVDAVFRRPPASTEHVLHPDAYAAGDPPIPVAIGLPASLAAWDVAHHTVWGEAGIDMFLRQHRVDAALASTAAAGWGGDRVALFVRRGRGDRSGVGVLRSTWDSEPDAIEAADALVRALDALVVGVMTERTQNGRRWLGLDGRVAWVERNGVDVTAVIGAPIPLADRLAAELPAAMAIARSP